jgi:hypothetical protein
LAITLFAAACLLLALSFGALNAVSQIMDYIIRATSSCRITAAPPQGGGLATFGNFVTAVLFPLYKNRPNEWNVGTLYGVFVWSTLMGVFWVLIFSTSVIIANISMKLQGVGPWLDRRFQVRSQPFKILAALTIICIVAVCMIYHMFVWIA